MGNETFYGDGLITNKGNSLSSVQAALDYHLKSRPYSKKISICDNQLLSETTKTLNSSLKQLANEGKISNNSSRTLLTCKSLVA